MTTLQLRPARRERLADILYGQIFEQIARGAFKEGDKLPSEAAICQAFEVSRPVVRQALMRLQADGLVYARQGSGSFVKSRPPERLTEFVRPAEIAGFLRSFEPRIALEAEAARLAALRHSRGQLSPINEALSALRRAFERGEAGRDEDFAFHAAVAAASGNALFLHLLEELREATTGMMTIALGLTRVGSDERRRLVLDEHRHILDAITAKDSEAASLYMRYHLTQTRSRVTDMQKGV